MGVRGLFVGVIGTACVSATMGAQQVNKVAEIVNNDNKKKGRSWLSICRELNGCNFSIRPTPTQSSRHPQGETLSEQVCVKREHGESEYRKVARAVLQHT